MRPFFSSGGRSRCPTPPEEGAALAAGLVPVGSALAQAESASNAAITKNTLKSVTCTGRPFLERSRHPGHKKSFRWPGFGNGRAAIETVLQYLATMNVADELRQPSENSLRSQGACG